MPSPTQITGAEHEARAESLLVRSGYIIVERNWRGGGGEVDRIAWDGEVLCFIEVRARKNIEFGTPAESVNRGKQRRIVRAAMAYVMRLDPKRLPMMRFDVVSIVGTDSPRPNSLRPGTGGHASEARSEAKPSGAGRPNSLRPGTGGHASEARSEAKPSGAGRPNSLRPGTGGHASEARSEAKPSGAGRPNSLRPGTGGLTIEVIKNAFDAGG